MIQAIQETIHSIKIVPVDHTSIFEGNIKIQHTLK